MHPAEPFWEKVEKVNSRLIVPAVILLLFIIVYEVFFHIENHTLELMVKIADGFVILVFVVDLIFLATKAKSTTFFFRNYWLDILAVFPFGLLFNLIEQVYRTITGVERVIVGQAIVHEGLEVRKEIRLVAKSERLAKFFRIGARLLRVITKTRLFSRFHSRKYVPEKKDQRHHIVPHPAYLAVLVIIIIVVLLFVVEKERDGETLRPIPEFQQYLTSFTAQDYGGAAEKLIDFYGQVNGLNLAAAVEVDLALAKAVQEAAEDVRSGGQDLGKEKASCQTFNGFLNPALLVMDLTLWSGKSEIYSVLQEHKEIGERCLFYYPQLSHGMFTYDVYSGRIVQRSVFCDPSEQKSKCFGVWDYFWRYALEPVNYGAGCSLMEWMNSGFVCGKGIDVRNEQLKATYIIAPHYGTVLEVATWDIKNQFQNALGASGKSIIDNVKQKCAKIKEKTSKYGDVLSALSAGSSLTGGVVSTEIDGSSNIEEEYEKAMLFASLFSEACVADPAELAADLAGGGGAGQFGLNKPKACVLSAVQEIEPNGLQEEVECLDHFLGSSGLEKVQNLDGLPDNRCLPSAAQGGSQQDQESSCRERADTSEECGQPPTEQEEKNVENYIEESKKRYQTTDGRADNAEIIIFKDKDAGKVCGSDTAAACVNKDHNILYLNENLVSGEELPTAPTDVPSLLDDGTVYDRATAIGHEINHLNLPSDSHPEIYQKDLDYGNFVQPAYQPAPDQLEPDECSAQAKRIDALADCLEQSLMGKLLEKEGRRPAPDPAPPGDEVGGAVVPSCDESTATGAGGYWGTKKNSADDCINGDFCDFGGYMYATKLSSNFNKKCQMIRNGDEESSCPPLQ